MGLFGKLFEKKECAICGGEIGLLGNRKLEDGNMCKACAAKLSPWFDERRHSTVAQIEEQLEYRESNKENVAAFRTTLSLGETAKVLLDEYVGRFIVYVNNPYFDDMRFKVNSRTVEVEERRGPAVSANPGSINLVIGSLSGAETFNPEASVEYCTYRDLCERIVATLLENRQSAREAIRLRAESDTGQLINGGGHGFEREKLPVPFLHGSSRIRCGNRVARMPPTP